MSVDRRIRDETERGRSVTIHFDGRPVPAFEGESVAAALWAADQRVLRSSSRLGSERALFCNMGICFECLVLVDGVTVRACMTQVRDGMRVESGRRR